MSCLFEAGFLVLSEKKHIHLRRGGEGGGGGVANKTTTHTGVS
jgi:hypothetical protein